MQIMENSSCALFLRGLVQMNFHFGAANFLRECRIRNIQNIHFLLSSGFIVVIS